MTVNELVRKEASRIFFGRGVATLVDLALFALPWFGFLYCSIRYELNEDIGAWLTIGLLLLFFCYFGLFEHKYGKTLGKRLMGLSVVDNDGRHPSARQILIRTSFRLIEVNPLFGFGLALWVALISKTSRRIGDYAAGTYVARDEDLRRRAAEAVSASPSSEYVTEANL